VRLDQPRSLALPFIAGALIGGCQSGAAPANDAAAAVPVKPAAANPAEIAQRLVVQRLGGQQPLAFSDVQLFNSEGATIVCGRVTPAGAAPQRYIAVGEEDVFVESQMEAGHMDRAVAEFCRNA
jgi:hypothetical protein